MDMSKNYDYSRYRRQQQPSLVSVKAATDPLSRSRSLMLLLLLVAAAAIVISADVGPVAGDDETSTVTTTDAPETSTLPEEKASSEPPPDSLPAGVQAADCWNFATGSRCDNENFWKNFGYKSCNDNCISKHKSGGKCEKRKEKCGFLTRTVKTCVCH